MKPTFMALLALCLCLGGCGKKEQLKEAGAGEEGQPKSKPKVDPTKHERFLWEFKAGRGVESSPAIGADGTVYVGSNDTKLYAINGKRGVKLWEFEKIG